MIIFVILFCFVLALFLNFPLVTGCIVAALIIAFIAFNVYFDTI